LPCTGEICKSPLIPTVDTSGRRSTQRAARRGLSGLKADTERSFLLKKGSYLKAMRECKKGKNGHLGLKELHEKMRKE